MIRPMRLARRVASIKALKVAIQEEANGPPRSMKAVLQGIFGKAEPNAKMIAKEREISVERRAADDLNGVLRSMNCAPVDIDSAIAAQEEKSAGGPVAPNIMSDELVPAPHQH